MFLNESSMASLDLTNINEQSTTELLPSVRDNYKDLRSQRRYSKKELFETLRDMDYGSIFASQSALKGLTEKFDFNNVERQQRANMI